MPYLEQLHQLVHKFFHFAYLKSTFSILHTYFYKTPHISLSILYVYSNKIFISLPTQPPTYSHRPTPESTQPTGNKPSKPEKQTQQQDRRTRNQHNLTVGVYALKSNLLACYK